MEVFAQTQDRYIKDLLEIGVRYFDLRICRDKDTLYMCHQSVDCYDSEDYRVINPIVDLVDQISDTESMVWPKEGAYYINPKLRELLEKNTNLYTGCLVCDYIDSFLARAIYMTNFDVPADSMVQYGGSW